MKNRKDKKNALLIALVIAVVTMGIGYAALSTTLVINGTARIDSEWDVEITGITKTSGSTGVTEATGTPAFTATTATFDVTLSKPGDEVVYTINIENNGTLDAKLDNISWEQGDANTPDLIKYSVQSAPANNSVLAAGGNTTVVVKVYWDDSVDIPSSVSTISQTKTITGTISYVQNTSSSSN